MLQRIVGFDPCLLAAITLVENEVKKLRVVHRVVTKLIVKFVVFSEGKRSKLVPGGR